MEQGTKIEYTADNLGAMFTRGSTRMVPDLNVIAGERGTYLEPFPEVGEPGWHWTVINHQGTTVFVPVHESMFKVVEASNFPPIGNPGRPE